MPSGSTITQIWAKLRGIAHIWVNPQIWVIPESDHPELREITLALTSNSVAGEQYVEMYLCVISSAVFH